MDLSSERIFIGSCFQRIFSCFAFNNEKALVGPFSEYCEYGCIHIDIKIGELLPASTLSICIAEAPLSKLCYTGHMAQLRATYAMSNDLFLVWTDNNDNNRLGVCSKNNKSHFM